jgi:hypothetical protein
MISSGIELENFGLVAKCLNQLRYGVPRGEAEKRTKNKHCIQTWARHLRKKASIEVNELQLVSDKGFKSLEVC